MYSATLAEQCLQIVESKSIPAKFAKNRTQLRDARGCRAEACRRKRQREVIGVPASMPCSLCGRATYRANDAGDAVHCCRNYACGRGRSGRYNEPSVNAPAGESEAPKDQHRKEQHHSEVQEDIEGQRWMLTRRAAPGDRFQAMRPHCRGDDCNFETVVDSGCWRGGRLVDRPINCPVTTPPALKIPEPGG
jgi:hypothetical protein